MTNGFDACGITQFMVKILQNDVKSLKDIVDTKIVSKDILRSDMSNSDTRCD